MLQLCVIHVVKYTIRHIYYLHFTMEDELTCPVCHKHFKNKISLKKHKARQHSEKGPVVYHCEFCETSCLNH